MASIGPSVSKMEGEGKWRAFRCALTVAHASVNLAGGDAAQLACVAAAIQYKPRQQGRYRSGKSGRPGCTACRRADRRRSGPAVRIATGGAAPDMVETSRGHRLVPHLAIGPYLSEPLYQSLPGCLPGQQFTRGARERSGITAQLPNSIVPMAPARNQAGRVLRCPIFSATR